ncbi:MAG TPA: helix-turn-helix domain-containing protein [Rhizobiaceae bacterium]|nr:helix-turn-helix domain-containing protein [Rhizobiaceae bacterium]
MEQLTTPSLAGSVGQYREAPPAPLLRMHFSRVWTQSIPVDHAGPFAVVPDGCVDLLWRDGRLMVAGPDMTASLPFVQPGSTILGVRFQPGAAAKWLGLPMSEIVGREVDLDELWGSRARDMSDIIGEKPTLAAQAEALQAMLLRLSPDIEPAAPEAAAIFNAVGRASGENGVVPLLREELETSERTLRRRSHDYFGYGPKMLARVLRFQKFLSLALADPDDALSGLAFDAGYADQPHLSREIQALCGMTPLTFVRQLKR